MPELSEERQNLDAMPSNIDWEHFFSLTPDEIEKLEEEEGGDEGDGSSELSGQFWMFRFFMTLLRHFPDYFLHIQTRIAEEGLMDATKGCSFIDLMCSMPGRRLFVSGPGLDKPKSKPYKPARNSPGKRAFGSGL